MSLQVGLMEYLPAHYRTVGACAPLPGRLACRTPTLAARTAGTRPPTDPHPSRAAPDEAVYPAVLKGSEGNHGKNVFMVRCREDVLKVRRGVRACARRGRTEARQYMYSYMCV